MAVVTAIPIPAVVEMFIKQYMILHIRTNISSKVTHDVATLDILRLNVIAYTMLYTSNKYKYINTFSTSDFQCLNISLKRLFQN
ncbi:hypothetical protein ACJX0J_034208, partial [Zea mays]